MRVSREELRHRAAETRSRLAHCDLCPRHCGVDRLRDERGYCGLGSEGRWYRELLHHGDEPDFSPGHLLNFAGCNLRCAHCSEGKFVDDPSADGSRELNIETMATLVARRRSQGARSLVLAGGNPDVQLPTILELLAACPQDTFVVWNSNLWINEENLTALRGVVDLQLPDFKYGNDGCARRIADAPHYVDVLRDNLTILREQEVPVLVRHLLLPGHFECCTRPILTWLRRDFPAAAVNLMTVYLPFDRLNRRHTSPSKPLEEKERNRAISLLRELSFPDARVDGDPFRD